jgi:uncharacterized glyoxalase superfamily protein PhnB
VNTPRFRVGLRVDDVPAATAFYGGLGVALGLGVHDLDAIFDYCSEAGCTITCEPMDEAWGERLFECIDPFGYQWEFSRPIDETAPADALAAVRTSWFGEQER